MQAFISFLTALFVYLSSLTSAIPAFVTQVKNNPNFSWMIVSTSIKEKSYEEYFKFYQENYPVNGDKDYGDPSQYPDVTEGYQTLMDENLELVKKWKVLPNGRIEFYKASSNGGDFDYKLPEKHKDLMEKWGMEKDGPFTIYGVVTTWEALGNFNFAFCGAALGFPAAVMKTAGGVLKINSGAGDWNDYEFFFDDEQDVKWIDFGIALYAFIDSKYLEQSKLLDSFCVIMDPRLFATVFKIYKDMK